MRLTHGDLLCQTFLTIKKQVRNFSNYMVSWTHFDSQFWLANQRIKIFSRYIYFISYYMLRLIWLVIRVGLYGYPIPRDIPNPGNNLALGIFKSRSRFPRFRDLRDFWSSSKFKIGIPKKSQLGANSASNRIRSSHFIDYRYFSRTIQRSQLFSNKFLTVQRKLKLVTELVWMEEKWIMADVCVNRRIRARVVRRPLAPQSTDATNESENLMEVLWSAEDLRFLLWTDRQRVKIY